MFFSFCGENEVTEMIFPAQVTIITQHFSHIEKYRL